METRYQNLINLASEVVTFTQRRGYYYAFEMWNEMYNNWCRNENAGSKDVPDIIKSQLKSMHYLFKDYFI